MKNKYYIKHTVSNKSEYWEIVKPNGKTVNGAKFIELRQAEKWLNMLVAMGYCKK